MKHIYQYENQWFIIETEKMDLLKVNEEFSAKLNRLSLGEIQQLEDQMNQTQTEQKPKILISEPEHSCNRLILNISNNCNLGCTYCYAETGTYGESYDARNMTEETMKRAIDQTYHLYPSGIQTVQFFGGEPLLNFPLIQSTIQYIKKISDEKQLDEPAYVIQTNGTLLNEEIFEFLNENIAAVTISIDGEKNINDSSRVFKDSKSSVFEKISENIQWMNEHGRKFYLALEGTINDLHIEEYSEKNNFGTFDALYGFESDHVYVGPVIKSEEKEREELLDGYKQFFSEWIKKQYEVGDTSRMNTIRIIREAACKGESLGTECGAARSDMAIDTKGNIYPCFMFIGKDEFLIGHVSQDFEELKISVANMREKLKPNHKSCENCWIQDMCDRSYGHCAGARYFSTGDMNKPAHRLCEVSKQVYETSFVEAMKMAEKNRQASR